MNSTDTDNRQLDDSSPSVATTDGADQKHTQSGTLIRIVGRSVRVRSGIRGGDGGGVIPVDPGGDIHQ